MKLQQLLSYTRKAVDDYHLIDDGDKIAIGVSGGKDSLALLYALHGLKRFYPKKFDILAVTADLGFNNFDLEGLKKICADLDVEYKIIPTQIAEIVFEKRQETNPCSLCAKMRKGAINQGIKEAGCNKIAYGHHKDDMIETMLMSLLYEGRFHTYSPKTYLDRMQITAIRPLLYVPEADIKGFIHKYEIPILKNPCPVDGHTKREYAKTLVKQLEFENSGAKNRMFTAAMSQFEDLRAV